MKITALSPGIKTFSHRGEILSIGQVFKGLAVYALGHSVFFFVRTPGGSQGRLQGVGVNGSLLGKKVDAKLVAYETKRTGTKDQAFLDFELVVPEQLKEPPSSVQPEMEPAKVVVQETVYAAAKRVNREINRHGLTDERRTEVDRIVLDAIRDLDDYTAEVKIGWTRELVAGHGEKTELAALVDKLRRHLGADRIDYQLPSVARLGQFDRIPERRAPREIAPEDPTQKPAKNIFVNKDFSFFSRQCAELRRLAAAGKAASWSFAQLNNARDLVRWLNYLLAHPAKYLGQEYGEMADWPPALVDEYIGYLGLIRKYVDGVLSVRK